MAVLQCEICGGKLVGKPGGIFECDSCGVEYSNEWAKAKVQEIRGTVQVEGTVDVQGTVKVDTAVTIENLLKRGNIALEDGAWDEATNHFEQVLNINAENGEAYLGLLMASYHLPVMELLYEEYVTTDIISDKRMQRALSFSPSVSEKLAQVEQEREKWAYRKEKRLQAKREQIIEANRKSRAWNQLFSVANHSIGAISAEGDLMLYGTPPYNGLSSWNNMVSVSYGIGGTLGCPQLVVLGLRADGTVVAAGDNRNNQCNVQTWKNVIQIIAGGSQSVALLADGTVVVTHSPHNVDVQNEVAQWRNIVSICANFNFGAILGLKSDGTVVSTRSLGTETWSDIIAITDGYRRIYGLKADGTVVSAGSVDASCENWRDIISIAANADNVVGLKANGTVVVGGKWNNDTYYNASRWTDIIAVQSSENKFIGLKSDGTIIGTNSLFILPQWNLSGSLEAAEARKEAFRKQIAEKEVRREKPEQLAGVIEQQRQTEKRAKLSSEKEALLEELANLRGLFSGGKRKELEAKLAQIEKELKGLN